MVLKKDGRFAELENTMNFLGQEKCFENGSEQIEVCQMVDESDGNPAETLQSAFLKFKRNRQDKLQQQLALTGKRLKQHVRSEEQVNKLREKFVEQAKSYLGVPYARRYHKPGSLEYDAPLFLDCCGLVRKVLRDMKEDFGFSIGPWNQAYMFDTLPNSIDDVKDMKPGDLVFVSGTFYNRKKRKQRHNMVHVEIWAGDGHKTIGARWQKGKVEIHDSYQYVSKSYYNMVYHYKSIDTWLNGTCESFCSRHPWKSSVHVPGKRSIFSIVEADEPADDFCEEKCTREIENFNEGKKKASEEEGSVDKVFAKEGETVSFEKDAKEEEVVLGQEDIDWRWDVSSKEKNVIGIDKQDVFTVDKKEIESEKSPSRKVIGSKEEIFFRENCFENACFCNMCISNANSLALENEESEPLEVLHCHQMISTGVLDDDLDCLDEDRLISVDTTELKRCSTKLDLVNSIGGVLLDDMVGEMAQVSSRPNTGGTGAGSTRRQGLPTLTDNRRGKGGTRRRGNGDDDQSNGRREPSRPLGRSNPSWTRLHQKVPTFFIGGHNGAKMVEATLSSLGWKRIHDNNDPTFYLKWVECKKNLDFSSFREGEQLVNHIPNGNLLTTKIGLLTSLQEFDRVTSKVGSPNRRGIQMKDFVPETYKLQNQTEIENFIHHIYQDGEMWICKPTGMNQGKGIFLIRTRDELLEKLGRKNDSQGRQRCFPAPGRVVQRYILNPFLLNGYKADIRTYMLIAGTCPYMVFYHPGYVRLSLVPYSLNQEQVHAHLTNQYIQKKHPLYEQVKEETVWSLEQLQEYVNKTNNDALPPDWVFTTFTKRMQEIMLHCFQSVRYKLDRKLGYFDLLGFDFMLDESLNVWLIEINVNPALHTNCKILSDVIPELVDNTLTVVLEVFEKSKRREKLMPIENLGKFQLLFSDDKK